MDDRARTFVGLLVNQEEMHCSRSGSSCLRRTSRSLALLGVSDDRSMAAPASN